jgi:sugar lactone lactonase YvrE
MNCRLKISLVGIIAHSLFVAAAATAQQNVPESRREFQLQAVSPQFWNLVDHDAKLGTVATGFGFTEGPVWDDSGFLYVSDETINKIFRVYPDGKKEDVIALGDPDGNTYDRHHRLIDCASVLRAIIEVTPDGNYKILADRFDGKKFNSPNDVIVGPDGALYFTDPTLDLVQGETQEIPFQGVYRLGVEGADKGTVRLLTKDLSQPNGLAFSPDGKRLYIDDSKEKNIRVYDVTADGTLANGRIFGQELPTGKHEGVPVGMRVDRDGNVFVTGPKGIWVWDANGNHLGTIVMPEQPANLIWGGKDYHTLYITATTSVYRLETKTEGFVPYLDRRAAATSSATNSTSVEPAIVRVDATPSHAINSFDPDSALGSSMDVLSHDGIDKIYTPHIVQESLSAGWGPISYRNNSELRMAAWHWTENGTWSDAAHKSGYFTGSTELKEPTRYILSYALPHRGFSTSGDRPVMGPNLSYWKSNPYLTSKFTGENDSSHPQWVVVDLQAEKSVNAIRIAWENPYAATYQVEYWVGKRALDFDAGPQGEWKTFPSGAQKNAKGGTISLKLADTPVLTQYVRVLMTESSNTCDQHGSDDVRNCVGYAVRDIRVGAVDSSGAFVEIQKLISERPTTYTSSSIDPWHSSTDVNDTGGGEHTGFDLFFTSGITNNLPAMLPVTMLYGTPDDAAAQIAYVEKRGYPISYIEMGEEPDGKHAMPEDYAALYLQWATAIHKVDPKLKLGGPVFEGVNEDIRVWPDAQGKTSWMGRFVDYLKVHGRLADLSFVSFEHYPFEPCDITWKSLYSEPILVKHILQVWRDDGVPKDVPLMITEDHLAAGLTGPMTTIFAALWLADNVGAFFEGGGALFTHSPIQPQGIQKSCLGWASWSNFVSDENYDIWGYTSPYFAAHMINLEWVQHRSGVHVMFPASVDIKDADGNLLVTSYAVHRPDGNWSLMLVNRDETHSHTVRVVFNDSKNKREAYFSSPVTLVTFGSEQYVWVNDGPNSHADPDNPPVAAAIKAEPGTVFTLPKASITVLRGKVGALTN